MKNIISALLLITCILTISIFAVSCDTNSTVSNVPSNSTENEISAPAVDNSSAAPDNGKITYTVTVVNGSDNSPIEGIIIQFCDDENCKLPLVTGTDGKVTAEYEESEYHITITEAEGYTYEAEYYFEDGATEITISLDPVS